MSRNHRTASGRILSGVIVALALLLGSAACSSSDVSQSKFESNLKKGTDNKVTDANAKCITDKTFAAFTQKDINKLYTADKVEDVPSAVRTKFESIVAGCAKAT